MPTPTTCPGARMTQTTIVMRLAINVPIGKRTVRVSLACIRDKDCESTAKTIADSRDGAVEANGHVDEAPGVERQGALYPLLDANSTRPSAGLDMDPPQPGGSGSSPGGPTEGV